MRVVQFVATSGGGVGRHAVTVSRLLAEDGNTTVLAAPNQVLDSVAEAVPGVRTVPVDLADHPRPGSDLRALFAVRRLIRGADVVHAHGVRAGAVAVLAARSMWGRRPGCRRTRPAVVVTVHNAKPSGGFAGVVFTVLERVVAFGADAVLVVSGDIGDRMRRRHASRVSRALVPTPTPCPRRTPDQVRAELGVTEETFLLVTVARLAQQKGLPVLVEALASVGGPEPTEHGGMLAVIAGEGPLRESITGMIRARGIPARLLGARSDAVDLLNAADVVVLPSLWEGQPLVVQEALHLGKPIVATDVGGTGDVCGDAAILVPARDPKALAEALIRLRDAPEERIGLARRAAEQAGRLPTESALLGQLQEVYRTVCEPSGWAG
jgi:glycosyltransferase involved in cell wall biosynthesis